MVKYKIIPLIAQYALPFAISQFGVLLLKELPKQPYLGILTIILSFILLYFTAYLIQIKENQERIKEIGEEIDKIKQNEEIKEKLLNSIKDIILLNNLKRR